MSIRRWISTALALPLLIFSPLALKGQAVTADCRPLLHRTPPEVRDSLLQSLKPEEIVLTGFVRDEATGEPVPGAVLTIEGSGLGTTTSADGGYLIRLLNLRGSLPSRPMVRVCTLALEYLTDIREVVLTPPWDGIAVMIDRKPALNPGYAVRIDFIIRRTPPVF